MSKYLKRNVHNQPFQNQPGMLSPLQVNFLVHMTISFLTLMLKRILPLVSVITTLLKKKITTNNIPLINKNHYENILFIALRTLVTTRLL